MSEFLDAPYINMLQEVLHSGIPSMDRTGVGTLASFGLMAKYDILERIPLLTTKKVSFRNVLAELMWFLSGSTNANVLKELGVRIWDEWAPPSGELGLIYGHNWRSHNWATDQLQVVRDSLVNDPESRRHVVSLYNPSEVPFCVIPPCHGTVIQFQPQDGQLNCVMYQRSADMFLGVPYNIASYSILIYLLAKEINLLPGVLTHMVGNGHIYVNHLIQVKEHVNRDFLPSPKLEVKLPPDGLGELISWFPEKFDKIQECVKLVGYNSHPSIRGDVAV